MQWNAAGYLRLSRDDRTEGESESITNQRAFVELFAEQSGIDVRKFYVDDGYTGTNYNRPGFKSMLEDIEAGKINCVVVKDLSRLGRDVSQTTYYQETYFPTMGVRFIAISDSVDSAYAGAGNDMVAFKAAINEMYARDVSKKVRAAIETKRRQGKFIGSVPPYGYKKDPLDKNHLVVDGETAVVVRRIFSLALQGEMLLSIATQLSADGVYTPSQQKGLTATQKRFSGVWNDGMIKRILTNETYIGNLVQNRSRTINFKVSKKKTIPKEDWVIVNGTHQGIVSKEDFEQVQIILANRPYANTNRTGKPHLLSGLVYCRECGAPMSFVRESAERSYLCCSTWRKYARLKKCTSHCTRESLVENAIKQELRRLVSQMVDFTSILESGKYDFAAEKKELQGCRNRLQAEDKKLVLLYSDKLDGKLPEAQFTIISHSFTAAKQQLERRVSELEARISSGSDMLYLQDQLQELLEFSKLDRAMLITLVHKVVIGQDKEITIEFNFEDNVTTDTTDCP